MKILLIGGAGFIGSHLAQILIELNHEVVILDNYTDARLLNSNETLQIRKYRKQLYKGAKLYTGELATVGNGAFSIEKPDVVVQLAAHPLEKSYEDDISRTQITDDIAITYDVVKLAKQYHTKKFIYLSSLFAYGDFAFATTEERALIPKTAYGISKAAGEQLVISQCNNWNIIRTTSVYGFGDLNNRATQILINKALNNEKAWVNTSALLDFIYIKDLARGITAVIEAKNVENEVFHISGGKAIRLLVYAAIVQEYFPEFTFELGEVNDRPLRGTLVNDKARQLLKWRPEYSLKEGVFSYCALAKEYKFA